MSHILDQICAAKRTHIAAQKKARPQATLLRDAESAPSTRGFEKALRNKISLSLCGRGLEGEDGVTNTPPPSRPSPAGGEGAFALIAEIKKASPSKGLIREDFYPMKLAEAYAQGGATCLSVLTDAPFFQGDDTYLQQAKDACLLPVLRKDFMLDPYQIIESRALGADCILLIMACLDDHQAKDLFACAKDLQLDALVEVHNEWELERAVEKLEPTLLGTNNRNLKDFTVDLALCERLVKYIPKTALPVAESGIKTHADLQSLAKSGIYTFLVGESLMREADVAAATHKLLNA